MKKSFSLFAALLVTTSVMVVVFGASVAFAANDHGLTATAQEAGLAQYGKDLPKIAGNIIGAALSLISVLFFALMLYGGIRAMLARGKSEEFSKAIDTIIHAIIGILIVFGAYAITTFILNSVGPQGSGSGGAIGGSGGSGAPGEQFCLTDDDQCLPLTAQPCPGTVIEGFGNCQTAAGSGGLPGAGDGSSGAGDGSSGAGDGSAPLADQPHCQTDDGQCLPVTGGPCPVTQHPNLAACQSSIADASKWCLRRGLPSEGQFMCSQKALTSSGCLYEFDSNSACQAISGRIFNSGKQSTPVNGCTDSVASCIGSASDDIDLDNCIRFECEECSTSSNPSCNLPGSDIGGSCTNGAGTPGSCVVSSNPGNTFCTCVP